MKVPKDVYVIARVYHLGTEEHCDKFYVARQISSVASSCGTHLMKYRWAFEDRMPGGQILYGANIHSARVST